MRNLFIFIFSLLTFSALTQTLKVNINSIRNDKGNIRLVFYKDSKSFDDEKAFMIKIIPKAAIKNGALFVSYSGLKPGTYGIAILDDENANEKMDYGMVLPKEGFGFSNYFHTGMSRPKFENFDFVIDKADVAVEIKVRYM